jgi:hypothetical protein
LPLYAHRCHPCLLVGILPFDCLVDVLEEKRLVNAQYDAMQRFSKQFIVHPGPFIAAVDIEDVFDDDSDPFQVVARLWVTLGGMGWDCLKQSLKPAAYLLLVQERSLFITLKLVSCDRRFFQPR